MEIHGYVGIDGKELEQYQGLLKECINIYNNEYIVSNKDVPIIEIIIADDMLYYTKKYAETEEQKAQIKNHPKSIENNNGLVVPTLNNNKYYILINKKAFNNINDYIHTIFHEYTHVLDYYKFIRNKNLLNFDWLIKDVYMDAFYIWSEYHARLIGTRAFYKEYFNNIKIFNIESLLNNQLKGYFKYLNNQLNDFKIKLNTKGMLSFNANYIKIMYEIAQYFGRFALYKEYGVDALTIEEFPKNELINIFGDKILGLYDILLKSNDYSDAVKKLNEITYIIEQIGKDTYHNWECNWKLEN